MDHQNKPDPTAVGPGVTIAQTLFCIGVFYVIMMVLNGAAMQESASLAEFGWRRDALCRLNRPFERLSRLTGAYRFRVSVRSTVGQWLNREANP